MTLEQLKSEWVDEPQYHHCIHEEFCELVNSDAKLKAHRDYVEQNVFGFGERSFWWAWKLILDGLPENPKLLEVGVFKGATLSVWKLLRPDAYVYGVTPLDDSGLEWTHDPGYYKDCIVNIHDDFELNYPILFIGKSEDPATVEKVDMFSGEYDVIYVDGDHSEEGALSDLTNYAPMVKPGGFLVIDDCCCDMHMEFGYFQGIASVQSAFDKWDKTGFEFVFNVKHLRILCRTK